MIGFLALAIGVYFICKANTAMERDDDWKALGFLLLGTAVLFVLGSIFL